MATGPCLCGDTYCPSCGDPSLAAYEEAIEDLCEKLFELKLSEYELELFKAVGFKAIEHHRQIIDETIADKNYKPLID